MFFWFVSVNVAIFCCVFFAVLEVYRVIDCGVGKKSRLAVCARTLTCLTILCCSVIVHPFQKADRLAMMGIPVNRVAEFTAQCTPGSPVDVLFVGGRAYFTNHDLAISMKQCLERRHDGSSPVRGYRDLEVPIEERDETGLTFHI